jgi:hypothetical protein
VVLIASTWLSTTKRGRFPPPPRKKIKEKLWARAPTNLWTRINASGARGGATIRKTALSSWSTLNKQGEDHVTFIYESLFLSYSKSTWWIDSGATIHIANSLQEFHTRWTLQRGERSIRVANGVKAEVEAIEELSLELNSGFILRLNNVLYVPSLSRNLISVSCLDDDRFDCQFCNR